MKPLLEKWSEGVSAETGPLSADVGPDNYAAAYLFDRGWPLATDEDYEWPVHCYGMVGVGRNLSPDTGSGAALYAVLGHAPRHLDRNIALLGRVVRGIEQLSSLPPGPGPPAPHGSEEPRVVAKLVRTCSSPW